MINLLNEMQFNNYLDFYNKRKILRIYYIILTRTEKRLYKDYIYSLNWKEKILDTIWCYLNEPKGSPYYVYEYELKELYKLSLIKKI